MDEPVNIFADSIHESISTAQFDVISHADRSIHVLANRHSVNVNSNREGKDTHSIAISMNDSLESAPLENVGAKEPEMKEEAELTRPPFIPPRRSPTRNVSSPTRNVSTPSIGYGSSLNSPPIIHERNMSSASNKTDSIGQHRRQLSRGI